MPTSAWVVLDRHLALLEGEAPSVERAGERVLGLVASDLFPVVCLPESAGELDPCAPGPAYVAALERADQNLLARLTGATWAAIRLAAARALQTGSWLRHRWSGPGDVP